MPQAILLSNSCCNGLLIAPDLLRDTVSCAILEWTRRADNADD